MFKWFKNKKAPKQVTSIHLELFKSFRYGDYVEVTIDGFYKKARGTLIKVEKYPERDRDIMGYFGILLDGRREEFSVYPESIKKIRSKKYE